jgi:hypothetical protein
MTPHKHVYDSENVYAPQNGPQIVLRCTCGAGLVLERKVVRK